MADRPMITAGELEKMSPDERARVVNERSVDDLERLSPDFKERVESRGRRLMEERGLLDVEQA